MARKNKRKKNKKEETIQEYFERRTGRFMTEYIAEHLSKALNKYDAEIFKKSLKITLDRNEVSGFKAPADLIKYMYGVCRNIFNQNTWEDIEL